MHPMKILSLAPIAVLGFLVLEGCGRKQKKPSSTAPQEPQLTESADQHQGEFKNQSDIKRYESTQSPEEVSNTSVKSTYFRNLSGSWSTACLPADESHEEDKKFLQKEFRMDDALVPNLHWIVSIFDDESCSVANQKWYFKYAWKGAASGEKYGRINYLLKYVSLTPLTDDSVLKLNKDHSFESSSWVKERPFTVYSIDAEEPSNLSNIPFVAAAEVFQIFLIEDEVLFWGDTQSGLRGTSSDKRPNSLDHAVRYFKKKNAP
jgi:hypothetical protein